MHRQRARLRLARCRDRRSWRKTGDMVRWVRDSHYTGVPGRPTWGSSLTQRGARFRCRGPNRPWRILDKRNRRTHSGPSSRTARLGSPIALQWGRHPDDERMSKVIPQGEGLLTVGLCAQLWSKMTDRSGMFSIDLTNPSKSRPMVLGL
jgi:hypothetical protein